MNNSGPTSFESGTATSTSTADTLNTINNNGLPDIESGDNPLTIGTIQFDVDECPSDLEFGHTQAIASHEYIGGGRTVQSLGRRYHDVTWTGRFTDTRVGPRIQALKRMETDGNQQLLTWWQESYYVVVTEFKSKYYHAFLADYSISIKIIKDASGATSLTQAASVDSAVNNAYTLTTAQNNTLLGQDPTGWATASAAITGIGQEILNASPIGQNPLSTASLLTSVQSALTTTQQYIGTLSVFDSKFVGASRVASYLGTIAKNVQAGQSPNSITVNGGNLYAIAARYYGDPTLATQIMAANNLFSVHIQPGSGTNIVLPPLKSINPMQ